MYIDLCQSLPRYSVWLSDLLLHSIISQGSTTVLKISKEMPDKHSTQALEGDTGSIFLGKVPNPMFSDFKKSAELGNLIGINTNMSELALLQYVGNPTYPVLLWIHITQELGPRKKKKKKDFYHIFLK